MPQSLQFFFRKNNGRIINTILPAGAEDRSFGELIPKVTAKFGLDTNVIIKTRGEYSLNESDLGSSIIQIVEKYGNRFEVIQSNHID